MDMLDRAITGLARCSVRVVPAERREWAEAVWAEAGEVPAHERVFWVAGGLWSLARDAGIVRRVAYWLGAAALAVGAASVVLLVWQGAPVAPGLRSLSLRAITMGKPGVYIDPSTSAEFRSLAITTVVELVALPWVARKRGAFGPVGDSWAARVVRVGGSAAICLLVLVLARLAQTLGEDLVAGVLYPGSGSAVLKGVSTTALTLVLVVAARLWLRGPKNTETPEPVWALLALGIGFATVIWFFFGGTWFLITAYVAGILVVTARESRIAPATFAFGAGAGVAGGLLWYGTARTGDPWLTVVVALVAVAAPAAAGAAAERRTPRQDDPAKQRGEGLRQGLVAGGLAGGTAALLITILTFGTMVVLHRQVPARTIEKDTLVLFGPLLGMAMGLIGASVRAGLHPKSASEGPLPGTSANSAGHLPGLNL